MLKDDKNQIDRHAVNEVIGLTKNILKVLLVLMIILISWVTLVIIRELKLASIFMTILEIVSPLFIGILIAWLFNPFVKWLQKKKVKRLFGVIISYALLIGGIALFFGTLIPILYEQILDFANTLPGLFNTIESWIDSFLSRLDHLEFFDMESAKNGMFQQLDEFGNGLYEMLPDLLVQGVGSIISVLSTVLVGFVIGFFLLLSFDDVEETFIYFFPKKMRKSADYLFGRINETLRNYVVGVLLDALVIFAICAITFGLVGLRAPLLFAIFCAITNVIPYVGPYIGAVPAVIVGFSMSPTIGLLTVASIVVIQFIEGNFLQEYILSKTTKLHPVTIILGLLVFGHFWGIIGMAISTPIIAIFKILFQFIDEKWKILDYVDEVD